MIALRSVIKFDRLFSIELQPAQTRPRFARKPISLPSIRRRRFIESSAMFAITRAVPGTIPVVKRDNRRALACAGKCIINSRVDGM